MLRKALTPNQEKLPHNGSKFVQLGLSKQDQKTFHRVSALYFQYLRFLKIKYYPLIQFTKNTNYLDSNLISASAFLKSRLSSFMLNIVSTLISWALPIVSLLITACLFYTSRGIPFSKFIFLLVGIGLMSYLLISGFVFFLKKYKYAKYTTATHRFWRRCLSIFWALEGYLFLVFLYLTIYSNQEPFFMYDNIQAFKDFCTPWSLFLKESALLILLIFIIKQALIFSKNKTTVGVFLYLVFGLWILTYACWCEFNQFLYTLSHYNSVDWTYDSETYTWSIEPEIKRTRVLLHFITICLIAKFWHFVFILGFWVFSLAKWAQSAKVGLSLLGANLQNIVILYLLNWIFMFPWLKLAFRKFLFKNYSNLYVNIRSSGFRLFFIELLSYTSVVVKYLPLGFFNLFPNHAGSFNLGGTSSFNDLLTLNPIRTEVVRSFWNR